ncbi:hypothetical protein BJF79_28060 [Actinomadura sp. CNU-125]|uniref:hypothetical protein n=1 Tax=Actinomadura sp. CNU-125 TaxID=1904961 RepID=UPI0009608E00|nr:hypothetical protein [Actinomadura sp. CNU-125]OLT38056.1 hypothetical protein BJF79_28060 [Actinomadura sp. CNU-125]
MSRRAAELLKGLAESGNLAKREWCHLTGETAYYWALAVLSDRPFELLDDACVQDLAAASALARGGPMDEWHRGLDVAVRLVDWLLEQARSGGHDKSALEAVFVDFDGLPDPRRTEIERHLDQVLSVVADDRTEARSVDKMRAKRHVGGREQNVWKFFEPVPAEPRPLTVRSTETKLFPLVMTVCGTILVEAGLAVALAMVTLQHAWSVLAVGVLLTFAVGLGCRFAPAQFPGRYSPFPARTPVDRRTGFGRYVAWRVEVEFNKRAPGGVFGWWKLATRQRRVTLTNEIGNLYTDPAVEPGAIDWLIAWHADTAAREWWERPGTRLRLPAWAPLIAECGAVAIAGWIMLLEMLAFEPRAALVMLGWIGGGVLLVVAGRADVRYVHMLHGRRAEETVPKRFAEEYRAYDSRCRDLEGRPEDTDMAGWLHYDKIYLRSLAMNEYDLGNRDVLAHAILTEAAPDARRARVRGGPQRFSAYIVWVFLLTATGVRQLAVHLDFPTGIVKDQDRLAYRYDAFEAVEIREVGLRFDDGRRKPVLPWRGQRDDDSGSSALILSQEFRLTLVGGNEITVMVENLDALPARGASGDANAAGGTPPPGGDDLDGALRLLEAVAADGREWIAQARSRQRRRLRDLPGAPTRGRPGEVRREMPVVQQRQHRGPREVHALR